VAGLARGKPVQSLLKTVPPENVFLAVVVILTAIITITLLCYTSPHQIPRTDTGRILRSKSATRQFKQLTGYPSGRPGYVIDHIIPLKRGGCDSPSNMQWQTIQEARDKDRWE
jgi:hypothetical protein